MKKVLIITYYWPPAGGIGVQRWLKFVKYLPEHGWEPIVVVPENPQYPQIDDELLKEVNSKIKILRIPIIEPGKIFSKLKREKGRTQINAALISDKKKGFFDNLSIWVRANIIIPDARRFWIRPVYKGVAEYLSNNNVDFVITTGPPHSVHLAGLKLKRKFKKIKWMADFRDPWTKIDYYKELNPGLIANKLQHYWEKKVVQNADVVVTVSKTNSEDFLRLGAKEVHTIFNGFDDDESNSTNPPLSKYFTVAHVGSFMANRNHHVLWEAMSELLKEHPEFKKDFRFQFVGNVDFSIKNELKKYGILDSTEFVGFVSKKEAVNYQQQAHVLLLVINKTGNPKGMITGKIFSYLASNRQIFLIGPPDGDAAEIIKKTETGSIAEPESKEQIKRCLLDYYQAYKAGEDLFTGNMQEIEKYSRRNLTNVLVNILNLKSELK